MQRFRQLRPIGSREIVTVLFIDTKEEAREGGIDADKA